MGINTYEVMYIQARDNYPYNVDECIEKLHYVIAADNEHTGAHFLMGRIYEEQLEDFVQAEYYYRMALYLNNMYLPAYYQYANLLIMLDRLEEADHIICLGRKIAGADKARLQHLTGLLYEKYGMYATARDYYTTAKMSCLNNEFMDALDGHIKRVKAKQYLAKKAAKNK